MLAARLHGPGNIRLHEEPMPEIGADEELLRVSAVGLCGSDRHWYVEGAIGDAELGQPLVLGHEVAGVIDSGPRRGARVVVDPAQPCNGCATCRAGRQHLCPTLRFAGHGNVDGGLRGYMSWPARLMHALPNGIDDDEATLLEPLGVALHAIDRVRLEPGMSAAVIGCGPIGLLLVQLLRSHGCSAVIAADPLPHRIEAARMLGALDMSDLGRVDVAFDASGSDAAVDLAIDVTVPGGTVVLVGIPDHDRTSFRASAARRKELTLSIARRMRAEDLSRAIDLAGRREIDLASLITCSVPLAQAPAAFAALAGYDGIKTVVHPNG